MAFAKRKAKPGDPISDRARALNDQIAALESEIKKLDTQLQHTTAPRLRSTALPHGATVARTREPAPPPKPVVREPVFEDVRPLRADDETAAPDQFNELGVRKYDLPALFSRLRRQFSRPEAGNQRLVTYLAAGGVHGLRPLRYEKRIARRRFILLVALLLIVLYVIFYIIIHNR
jgi:hypothetical protein